jgi:ribosome biogenesis GTPase
VILNKSDRWNDEARSAAGHWREVYAAAGIEVWFCSALGGDGIPELAVAMNEGTHLLTGYSGAGKSSLINALFPGLKTATGAISDFSGKGTHTTTTATLYETGTCAAVIDSPGIKEWGILDLEPYEIAYHFPEIREHAPLCRYPNCSHTHEPSCVVQDAVRAGLIHRERFVSYLSILANDDQYN